MLKSVPDKLEGYFPELSIQQQYNLLLINHIGNLFQVDFL